MREEIRGVLENPAQRACDAGSSILVRCDRRSGFTVVELLVVVSVIAIIAAIAVPNIGRARMAANERVVIATLRSLVMAQAQFAEQRACDLNNDGSGEYGSIRELLGVIAVRGSSEPLRPALMTRQISNIFDGTYHLASGYLYAVYLPDVNGLGVNAADNLGSVDPINASAFWCCIAWPAIPSVSGRTTYYVNQQGQIVKNVNTTYAGTTQVPPPGAALQTANPSEIMAPRLAISGTGADGRLWTAVE